MTTYTEWSRREHERQQAISLNRSRRMRNPPREPGPVPAKLERPKWPVAYEADGSYVGVLEHPDDAEPGWVVKMEPAMRDTV